MGSEFLDIPSLAILTEDRSAELSQTILQDLHFSRYGLPSLQIADPDEDMAIMVRAGQATLLLS